MRGIISRKISHIFVFVALVFISACGPPVSRGHQWLQSEPEEQGIDSGRLREALRFLSENSGNSGNSELVIVRHGVIIWRGDNIDHVHGIWSSTKSITSTMLGLLITDGKCTLETKPAEIVPDLKTLYPNITLRHFATMTSGYRAEDDDDVRTRGQSKTPFVPGQPMFEPGARFAYWDSAMNKFAQVLTLVAGEPLQDLFKRRIADPIGMHPDRWSWGKWEDMDGILINGGAGNKSKHLFTSARELARFGQLFLNEGEWAGQQVVDPTWIRLATQSQLTGIPEEASDDQTSDRRGSYGLNWWTNDARSDGSRKWPGAPPSTYAAIGYNNNFLFVVPEWKMVVVRLGLDEKDGRMSDATWSGFFERIRAALDPTNDPV